LCISKGSQVRFRVLNLKDIKYFRSSFGSQVDLYKSKQLDSKPRQGKVCRGSRTVYKTEKRRKMYTVIICSTIQLMKFWKTK